MSSALGTLYVVATPIGNLGDFTVRAREVLASAARIFAEDTRVTQTLLAHYGVATRPASLHAHNEASRAAAIVALLRAGESVALVTDAGTPAISDPGARLVAAVRAAGGTVVPIPGPSAITAALSASGVDGPFVFLGFLPARGAARRDALAPFAGLPAAIVLYEAPHRAAETVADLAATLDPTRTLVVARELTKKFESIVSLPLAAAGEWLAADPNRTRGEIVLVVGPPAPAAEASAGEAERVLRILLAELPVRQAVALAAAITGGKRNALYERALQLRNEPAE